MASKRTTIDRMELIKNKMARAGLGLRLKYFVADRATWNTSQHIPALYPQIV